MFFKRIVWKYGSKKWRKKVFNSVLNLRRVKHFRLCLLETQVQSVMYEMNRVWNVFKFFNILLNYSPIQIFGKNILQLNLRPNQQTTNIQLYNLLHQSLHFCRLFTQKAIWQQNLVIWTSLIKVMLKSIIDANILGPIPELGSIWYLCWVILAIGRPLYLSLFRRKAE